MKALIEAYKAGVFEQVWKLLEGSYFKDCPRDEKGHCKASGKAKDSGSSKGREHGRGKGKKPPPHVPISMPPSTEPPRGGQSEQHIHNLVHAFNMVDTDLKDDVRAGRLSQPAAADNRLHLGMVLWNMPAKALQMMNDKLAAWRWYSSTQEINQQYEGRRGEYTPAFYRPSTREIHVADNEMREYAEEIAHAIDGPDKDISSTVEFHQAWRRERNNIEDVADYYRKNREEWFAYLTSVMLAWHPDLWAGIKARCPKSSAIIERELTP